MPNPGVVLLAAIADSEKMPINIWLGKAKREGLISGDELPHIATRKLVEKLGREASQRIIAAYLRKIDAEAEVVRFLTRCQSIA